MREGVDLLAIGTTLGGYRIEGVLGEGGMGIVYEATQLSLKRTIALKVLPPVLSEDPRFRERFRREGHMQASIEHPHIVTVFEAGEIDGRLFIAMQLIRGVTLKKLIRDGDLDARRALRLLGPVSHALDAAHAAGLIHRDIKPHNVLIDGADRPFLADFGLTKGPDEATGLTRTGHFIGTVAYIAPEQIRGHGATPASDRYAFAAILFESLTGRVPYPRPIEAAVLHAHLDQPPPRITEVRPDLPAALDDVIARGMAKEPDARPATAVALVNAAADALEGTDPATLSRPTVPLPEDVAPPTSAATPVTQPLGAVADADVKSAPEPWPAGTARPELRGLRRRGWALALAALLIVTVVVALTLGPDGGGAPGRADVTLGSDLSAEGGPAACSGNPGETPACTFLQIELPGAVLAAPFNGVITAWRLEGARGTFRLTVLSAAGEPVATSEAGTSNGGRAEFETDLPIDEGQQVALDVEEGAKVGVAGTEGARYALWDPPLQEGEVRAPDSRNELEVLYNADIERE